MKAVCEGLNVSERRACKVLGQYRSTQRHVAWVRSDEDALTSAIVELATQYGRYGYKRVTGLLREAGWKVNKKRVERIWRQEGLKVPARQPKRGRLWFNDGSCVRLKPEYPNHVWAYDFVADRTYDGKAYRMLTVIDEFTRECLAIVVEQEDRFQRCSLHVGGSVHPPWHSGAHPLRQRSGVLRQGGPGVAIGRLGVGTLFIEPGSPWENGYIESFNGKLRDELLNREIFCTLIEARILIEQWRRHYNGVRPHSALGYRPPAPETIAFPAIGLPSPWNSMETPGGFLH